MREEVVIEHLPQPEDGKAAGPEKMSQGGIEF